MLTHSMMCLHLLNHSLVDAESLNDVLFVESLTLVDVDALNDVLALVESLTLVDVLVDVLWLFAVLVDVLVDVLTVRCAC